MANILNLGTGALLSLQTAINTTGHNISNVNTEGYSRQRVLFDTLEPQLRGSLYTGSGVYVSSIERMHDQFLVDEVRARTSDKANFDMLEDLTSKLDSLLSDPNVGLAPAMSRFFSAMEDVASDPASLPHRQVLLGEASNMATRFGYLDDKVNAVSEQISIRISSSVAEINGLAKDIANVNDRIASSRGDASGGGPNDLFDERDRLLSKLAERIGVTTVDQSDGTVNVMIGTGQALVSGRTANTLSTFADPYDSTELRVSVGRGGSDISGLLRGGDLGAALSFRDGGLANAKRQLGLVAMGVTYAVNAQNRLGQDLEGNLGGDLFKPLVPDVIANPANAGSASVTADVTNPTGLTGDDYSLYYDGAQYVLTNEQTNAVQTGAGPFTVDGITITPSGAPSTADRFVIRTASAAGGNFGVSFTRPEAIAAAAPVRTSVNPSNTGNAEVDLNHVVNTGSMPLASPITLTFDANAMGAGLPGFVVGGIAGGPLAYDPATQSTGATLSIGGVEVDVKGIPDPGDVLQISNNVGGVGDNRNAQRMSGLQTVGTLRGGSATFQDIYGSLVAQVGVTASQAKNSAVSENALLEQAKAAADSVSGVNLDEEAANLLRYQQAYQAAARIITAADEMFQTLMSATRR